MNLPLANLMFAPENWLLIGGIALLLFGKRLPEVGRSLGKGIVEFKKGLAGIEDDMIQASRQPTIGKDDRAALPLPSAAYKFDPYTGKPVQEGDEVDPDN
jgi:sec-independent protein translocase protein TatA